MIRSSNFKLFAILNLLLLISLTAPLLDFSGSATAGSEVRIGEWRTHLPYREGIAVEEVGNRIFCATINGLFYINTADNSRGIIDQVRGINGTHFTAIRKDPESGRLFIGYIDGNIDVLDGYRIRNIPDFKRFDQVGRKEIHGFDFDGSRVYIATAMGILEYDLENEEFSRNILILDQDHPDLEIFSTLVHEGYLYAATEEGLYRASLNSPNIQDPQYWEVVRSGSFHLLRTFEGRLYAASDNELHYMTDDGSWNVYEETAPDRIVALEVNYGTFVVTSRQSIWLIESDGSRDERELTAASDALLTENGEIYFSRSLYGMINIRTDGSLRFLAPNSPRSFTYQKFIEADNKLWGVRGSVTPRYDNHFRTGQFSFFADNRWTNYQIEDFDVPGDYDLRDFITIARHPAEPLYYIASFWDGLLVFNSETEEIVNHFHADNSTLAGRHQFSGSAFVSGLAFDHHGNLWVANYDAENVLHVYTKEGQWHAFSFPESYVGEMVVDDHNQLWVILPRSNGLMVVDISDFNQGGQLPFRKYTENEGDLPDNNVRDIAIDADGALWIATADGVGVLHSPGQALQGRNISRVFVADEVYDDGPLLRHETVTNIAIDAADNKWFAAQSGIWVTEPNGRVIIDHFNESNSPLLSNDIISIGYQSSTGEMFFSTDGGIISIRTGSARGGEEHSDVYAFPNPVREHYDGPIAIKGLVRNADVRITDVSGKLVYATQARGGQAVWEGRNMEGNEVRSGVYLVFSSDEDGSETFVTKILFIR